jgi:hypothetical protein
MDAAKSLIPSELIDFLLNIAPIRPVFIWGPPGIGKSSLVEAFADSVGLPCVSLLGSQLAPEDLIGVPQIIDGKSRFCPPTLIARDEPFCLFLDELNACSQEVQKAFYSLIHDRRIGEYHLPEGTVVIGAGNRAEDAAIVKPMSSALINCDASPHDRGFINPEELLGRVEITGRGGTILQPGVQCIVESTDFPKDGPLLIITDGVCDALQIPREHAFLLPEGAGLPFQTRAPIFRFD